MKSTLALSAIALSLLAGATQASAATINFETLAAGTTLSNQFAGLGVTFTPNAFTGAGSSTSGETWATNTDLTIVSSTGADVGGLGTPALVSGNILRSFAGWLGEDGDASFRASFSTPINSFSATFAGVSTAADVTLFAFNGSTLLSTVSGTGTAGQFVLNITGASITSVVVRPGSFNDWVGVDNIVFQPVPEPGTYGLMALGLAGLALVARRRAGRQAA